MKRYVMLFAILAAASTLAMGRSKGEQNLSDLRTIFPEHEIKPDQTKTDTLPALVDHSAQIPPRYDIYVGNAKCSQVAAGYFYKTAQEAREHGWSPADTNNQFSANFLAVHTNEGGPASWAGVMFQFLCDWGDTKVPLGLARSEAAYDTAINYRCQNWYWIDLTTDQGITALKRHLAGGDNAMIGFDVPAVTWINDSTLVLGDTLSVDNGAHAVCVFGYNDSLLTTDGPGAFHVADSDIGCYWISYATVKHPRSSWGLAFYSTDRIGYRPVLKMRARLSHPKWGEVMIRVGIGPTSAPKWVKTMSYNSLWGPSYVNGDSPFPDNNIVMDLTDGLPWLDSTSANNVFLECWDDRADGISGQIEYLSVEHLDWGVRPVSHSMPQTIPDYHIPTFSSVSLRRQCFSADVHPAQNQLAPGDSIVDTLALTAINGYALQLTFHAAIIPTPASGTLQVQFSPATLVPPGVSLMTILASPDLPPGLYQVIVTGSDGVDTAANVASVNVYVTGTGQALGVGASEAMMHLVRQVWPMADSVAVMPPVIGTNYQIVVLENGGTPADTVALRTYIQNGGSMLTVGNAPAELCGGNGLAPINGWLGAATHGLYTGSGMKIISTYATPFGVPPIQVGDTLGTATNGYSRLSGINTGAVLLARYGSLNTVIAALYNEFGTGYSLWVTGSAGFSDKNDSLIRGYLQHPALNRLSVSVDGPVVRPAIKRFAIYPNPVRATVFVQLGIERQCQLTITVYDVCGRRLRTLYTGRMDSGTNSIQWDGRDDHGRVLSSGIYFVKVDADGEKFYGKFIRYR